MRNSILRAGSVILLSATVINTVHAQPVLVDIAPCMAVSSASDKRACYERLEAEVRAAQNPGDSTAALPAPPAVDAVRPSAPAVEATPAPSTDQTVATFGTSTPASARVLTSTDGQQELHDRITDLQEREPGRYLITLASGQVWYQSNSQRFRLRKGMDVRIYPSPLGGSYRMARDDGEATGFVQVERLK